jgi:hypothetical protein
LTKEHAVLQEAELELSHVLATAWRTLEDDYKLSNTNFQRRLAAQANVEAVAAAYDTGTIQIDVLLQAQRLLAQAESDYYRSLVNYNKDIMFVHLRKGSLLEYNGVYLAEGPWPGKAYFDARRRARARDAATYIDYGFTQPRVISEGAYQQFSGKRAETSMFGGESEATLPQRNESKPEAVPTPAPERIDPGYNRKDVEPAIPPAPEPDATTAVPSARPGKTAKSSAAAAGGRSVTKATATKPTARKSRDIGSLKLNQLEDNPIQQTSAIQSDSGWETATPAPQKTSGLQWTASKQKPSSEPRANSSSASDDQPAAGWQGVQR